MQVVVTGAAGSLARALLPRLLDDPDIGGVTGIDLRPCPLDHRKLRFLHTDIGDAAALGTVRNAEALVHLAAIVQRGRTPLAEMVRVNVDTAKRLLGTTRATRVVHLSSAAVYGQGVALTEAAPLAPLPKFAYAVQKAVLERWLESELPHAARLRAHIVLGPHALPLLKQLGRLPYYVRLSDPQPRIQCVHEDDVAQAIVLALKRAAAGPFNLAAESAFSLRELCLARHPAARGVPMWAARAALHIAWRTTGWGAEPGWIDAVASSLTLDCTRARTVLGWEPAFADWRGIVAAAI